MRRFIPLVLIILSSCTHTQNAKLEQLQDTLKKVKLKLDFHPLDSAEAYSFINQYYLPRLDTNPIKRRLLQYPLIAKNYNAIFQIDSILLTKKYNGDTLNNITVLPIGPPGPIKPDTRIIWNNLKLNNTTLIIDPSITNATNRGFDIKALNSWHKKFGYGYMMVSYPLYNKHMHILVIRDWIENGDWCGTGREHDFVYHKIPGGWQLY
jgi:hypothetical protein